MAKPALELKVYIGPTQTFETGWGTFSPTTSTLIMGERDAVLVDAQHIKSDVRALGDMIEQTGRRLTTIYLTHAHADHWYGIGELTQRFPGSRAVATADVLAHIDKDKANAAQSWKAMFGDRVVSADVLPTAVDGGLELEGHELRIVEVGQGDIEDCTVLHVPAIDAVIPGDIVYNKVHMMLGLTTPPQWDLWLDSIDRIEAMAPKIVVAGHKRAEMPDTDVQRQLDESRAYIRTFAKASQAAANEQALVEAMMAGFPDFGNLWTLQFSARSFFERRKAAAG
jgi:glyoxylase-like metal-dependent hydrolase (beta-lactamase superfamily II)